MAFQPKPPAIAEVRARMDGEILIVASAYLRGQCTVVHDYHNDGKPVPGCGVQLLDVHQQAAVAL
jgi:hypothetical protein